MQYKLFTKPEVVEVKNNASNLVTTVKNTLYTKDILFAIIIILLVAACIMWFISSREVEKLREEKFILTQQLIHDQENQSLEIKDRAKTTDFRIETIEQRKIKNLENEKTIINNPVTLDVRAAEEFLAEYEPVSIDTTGN